MKYYILLLIIVILITPLLTSFMVRKHIGINNQKENRIIEIFKDHPFESSFTPGEDQLNSVALKLKNTGIRNHEPANFVLILNQDKLRTVQFNGSNIGDGAWTRLSFENIADSKNKTFIFNLSSPTTTRENSIAIQTDENGKPAIVTYHKVISYPSLIKQIYSQFIVRLFFDKLFFLYWLSCLLGSWLILSRKSWFENS